MKKFVALGITLLWMVGISVAQEESIEKRVQEKTQKLTEQLSLDESQQGTISAVLHEMFTSKKEIEDNAELSPEDKERMKKEVKTQSHAKILEELNDDQKILFREMSEQKDRVDKRNHEEDNFQQQQEQQQQEEEI